MVYKEPKQQQFMFGVCILLCLALAMKYTGEAVNEVTVTYDVVAISNERVRLMVVNISFVSILSYSICSIFKLLVIRFISFQLLFIRLVLFFFYFSTRKAYGC